ncbi:MAG: hypothetical protein ACRDOD_12260, partial [Streptosporangiaceae bacterium]
MIQNSETRDLIPSETGDPFHRNTHKLYWAACDSIDEARYLCAILNAPVITARTTPLQSRGLFGARDIDKYVWTLPIPRYGDLT